MSTNYYTANFLHPYLPLPQVSHLLTALLHSSFIKHLNFVCPLLATLPYVMSTSTFSFLPPDFCTFTSASESDILKSLSNWLNKQSDVDPLSPLQAVQIFGNISTALGTLAIHWQQMKISWRSSQGNPSAWGVKDNSQVWRFRTYQRLYLGNGAR